MAVKYFDFESVAIELVEIIQSEYTVNKNGLLSKIMQCLQSNIDGKIVPKNLNVYESKKRRQKWIKRIEMLETENVFWRRIIKQLSNDIEVYYSELDHILVSKGLKSRAKPGGTISCYYCQRKIDAAKYGNETGLFATQDHIIPKSKFGSSNHINLITACNECNFMKANLNLQDFIYKVQKMLDAKQPYMTIPISAYPIIIRNSYNLLIRQSK